MIAFDVETCRPGCALAQAALGCFIPDLEMKFPVETWIISAVSRLKAYPITKNQLDSLVKKVRERYPDLSRVRRM